MDPNLILIFAFVLVISTLAFATGMVIHRRQVRHEERKLELEARAEEAKAEQARYTKGDYGKLEERVRVLERIATDSNHALASQIEELRGLQAVEDRTATREVAR